ncbi:MAG: hypothetical protein GX221_11040 [Candidatus Riflebacteria bacterium]|nr:hypothetical protein [Candidatus Riflebacteria bacterium]
MRKFNNPFLLGAISAVLAVTLFTGNSFLTTIFAGAFSNQPKEIRQGVSLGLLRRSQVNQQSLKMPQTKMRFANMLLSALQLIDSKYQTISDLISSGIITESGMTKYITRKEVFETLCRSAEYFMTKAKSIQTPNMVAVNYSDYQVPAKYAKSAYYLQYKFIVRGKAESKFDPESTVTLREAVYFLQRFYEAISADMMAKKQPDKICFIDLPMDHFMMKTIRNLVTEGAFDKLMLSPTFDGDSYMNKTDFSEMVAGILERSGKEVSIVRLKTLFTEKDPENLTRRELALGLEYLFDELQSISRNISQSISYKDVAGDSPEYVALIKLASANIRLGYVNSELRPLEKVSRYETVTVLNKLMIALHGAPREMEEEIENKPVQKEDIQRLENIIREKQARIRRILGSAPTHY